MLRLNNRNEKSPVAGCDGGFLRPESGTSRNRAYR